MGKKISLKKKSGTDIFFVKEMLEFCGKTINIEMTENDFIFNFWDFKCGERYYWNKNWFVPNTVPRHNLRKALKNEKTFFVNIHKDKTLSTEIQRIAHQEGVFFIGSFGSNGDRIVEYGHSLIFEFDEETEKYHIFVACDEKTIIEYDVEYIPTTDSFILPIFNISYEF